jgi:hypothetical protein
MLLVDAGHVAAVPVPSWTAPRLKLNDFFFFNNLNE